MPQDGASFAITVWVDGVTRYQTAVTRSTEPANPAGPHVPSAAPPSAPAVDLEQAASVAFGLGVAATVVPLPSPSTRRPT